MPSSISPNRRRVMALIHIAKKDLAMDDGDYRAMLAGQTGKESCGDMTLSELYQVEHYLRNKMGWKAKPKTSGKRSSPTTRDKDSKKTMVDKLRALWIDMAKAGLLRDGSENALENWVQRMSAVFNHGQGIEKVDWLTKEPGVCYKLIESLKQWRKRLEEAQ